MRKRLVQSPGGADDRAPFDPHHAVMATRRDHLRVERRGTEDPTDDRPVALEAVGDGQGTCCELHARRDVTNERQGVPVAASPDDSRRPETRPDLNRREHPRRPRLPPGERPDLVGLQLCGDEAGGPAVAKVATPGGRPLEPAGDGVPGQPVDPGNRRQTDPLDTQRDDTVERRSAMLEAVIGRAFRRRERLSAPVGGELLLSPQSVEIIKFGDPGSGREDVPMRDPIILLVHLIATLARLMGPGGLRSVVAESVLVKQQLLILNRSRHRAPNLCASDRILAGVCALFMRPARVIRSAIVLRPSTILEFHRALRTRKCRWLFSPTRRRTGPQGPSKALVDAIVDI